MKRTVLAPNYIFESSWEVCNKVGGIYTVLSSRALTLQQELGDKLIFIGPDLGDNNSCFIENNNLFTDWLEHENALSVRVGRWDIPGNPIVILIDFKPFFSQKNDIYTWMWEHYQVDSLHAYGDYDEASMFSYAAGRVVESFYSYYLTGIKGVVYHGNEWMTGLGLLYIKNKLPQIATIFTTHATSIGRSIAGNNKPLYQYLEAYNGNQMADELNMQSKHSVEMRTAHNVDSFTTVSEITALECKELLDKPVDVVLPNGFEDNFVPKGTEFTRKRKQARKRLLNIANALLGSNLEDDTIIVSTSGRYEFRNKGIDVFIDALNRLQYNNQLQRNVLAFVEVPGWVCGPRLDLQERLTRIEKGETFDTPLNNPRITHWLHNTNDDNVLKMMDNLGMYNRHDNKVKVIFIPCYLTGNDGIVNMPYYDIVLGNDLCAYPSYYEPWGYTPLEAIAFHVPCITTDLAGFGLWVNQVKGQYGQLQDGVKVIHRTDYNYHEVADQLCNTILEYTLMSQDNVKKSRNSAARLSQKALWNKFIAYYKEAYHIALSKAEKRMNVK